MESRKKDIVYRQKSWRKYIQMIEQTEVTLNTSLGPEITIDVRNETKHSCDVMCFVKILSIWK